MDGVSVGILLADHVFDAWPSKETPWIVNLEKSCIDPWKFLYIKLWAWFHLPLIFAGDLYTKLNSAKIWDQCDKFLKVEGYTGKNKIFSTRRSIQIKDIQREVAKDMKSTIATALGKTLRSWNYEGKDKYGVFLDKI